MGGAPVIETIRPGVEFVPEAAAAFRRAEAQVCAEFGRDIDVNSTYRDWDTQLRMYNAWQAYITGRGPYPGHSKALHPADPLAFHTKGLALDSDDWVNERIVQILAEHGFIRNRLYVKNEQHHFEYLRGHDKHINDPDPREGFLMALTDKQQQQMYDVLVGSQQTNFINRIVKLFNGSAQQKAVFENIAGSQQGPYGDVIADRVLGRRIERAGRYKGKATTLRAVLAWADENTEGTRDLIRALSGVDVGEIDVKALADTLTKSLGPAVAAELAKRLAQ